MKRWESCNFAARILKAIPGTSAARPQAKSSNTNRKPFASAWCNRAILPGQMDIMLSPVPENWLHFPIGVPIPSKSVSLKGGNLKTMVVCWKGCAHLIDYNSLPCLLEFPSQLSLQKKYKWKTLDMFLWQVGLLEPTSTWHSQRGSHETGPFSLATLRCSFVRWMSGQYSPSTNLKVHSKNGHNDVSRVRIPKKRRMECRNPCG